MAPSPAAAAWDLSTSVKATQIGGFPPPLRAAMSLQTHDYMWSLGGARIPFVP